MTRGADVELEGTCGAVPGQEDFAEGCELLIDRGEKGWVRDAAESAGQWHENERG